MRADIELRRRRILDAMVLVVYERGYAGASVTAVSARAKVSRRSFCEVFDGLQACFLAVLDEGACHASVLMREAFGQEQSWLHGVRGALIALLCFFDAEPILAYVLLVEAAAAGPWARKRREQHLATLTSLIEQRWTPPREHQTHPLVNPGVMASLLGVLHTHLVEARPEPLIALLGSLMGLVSAPYLDQRLVEREIRRGDELAHEILASREGPEEERPSPEEEAEMPELVRNPRAHRARACLRYLADHPGASNRQIADAIGIHRHTHISTLLARLADIGLLHKQPGPPGHPNAWSLTPQGHNTATLTR